jgi:hypothetical protein
MVLELHSDSLMNLSGVVGTAEGLDGDQPCILVMVVALTAELERSIPKEMEGYPVRIEETGEFRARG